MMTETKAFEILEDALEALSVAGLSYLAGTIRLTVENEMNREE